MYIERLRVIAEVKRRLAPPMYFVWGCGVVSGWRKTWSAPPPLAGRQSLFQTTFEEKSFKTGTTNRIN
jgi:hypothetical protein